MSPDLRWKLKSYTSFSYVSLYLATEHLIIKSNINQVWREGITLEATFLKFWNANVCLKDEEGRRGPVTVEND